MTDRLDTLERLGRLRDQGLLTDEEFGREKARVLAGTLDEIQPQSVAVSMPGRGRRFDRIDEGSSNVERRSAAEDDVASDLMSVLRPVNDVPSASQQVSRVWAVAALLIGGEIIFEFGQAYERLAHRSWSSSVSVGETIITGTLGLTVSTLAILLVSLWIARRASRVGVVILAILSLSAAIWPIVSPEPMRLMVKVGSAALAVMALWYLVGVWRGAFWLAGRRPVREEPDPAAKPTLKEAWSRGREVSRPFRHAIRWIGVGGMVLFVLGGAAWYWHAKQNNPAFEAASVVTSPDPAPSQTYDLSALAEAPTASDASAVGSTDQASLTRETLVGSWAIPGNDCIDTLYFDANGVFSTINSEGPWRLDGDIVSWNAHAVNRAGGEVILDSGSEVTARVVVLGPGRITMTPIDGGETYEYEYCGP